MKDTKMRGITKNFTMTSIKRYLKDPNSCPQCQSQSLVVDEEFTEETKGRVIRCQSCNITFYEVFKLIYIEKIPE